MAGRCMEHAGLCVEIKNAQKDIIELKETEKKQSDLIGEIWKEIRKKPSTATLLIGLGIIASIIMTLLSFAYQSHQERMRKLEAVDVELRQKMDDQHKRTVGWLNAVYSKIPDKKQEPKKK